ncbi:MAG: hypothetical protein OXB86_02110 [Bdellovibrionales bacterium]|nr:hypothetical protein [Bdellovibrionales bacterium]
MKYIIFLSGFIGFWFFSLTISPAYSQEQKEEDALSEEKKAEIRETLYLLSDLEKERGRKRETVGREEVEFREIENELGEEQEELAEDELLKENQNEISAKEVKRVEDKDKILKKLFEDKQNNPYLKDLFKTDERLSSWIREDPYMLYSSLRFENMDMTQFFTENGSMGPQDFLIPNPLFGAIALQNIEAIHFFKNHPRINLEDVNEHGDNIVHFVFLGPSIGFENVFKILFHEDFFPKISHLLNKPNKFDKTSYDLALQDQETNLYIRSNTQGIIGRVATLFSEKGALRFQDLPGSGNTRAKRLEREKSIYRFGQGNRDQNGFGSNEENSDNGEKPGEQEQGIKPVKQNQEESNEELQAQDPKPPWKKVDFNMSIKPQEKDIKEGIQFLQKEVNKFISGESDPDIAPHLFRYIEVLGSRIVEYNEKAGDDTFLRQVEEIIDTLEAELLSREESDREDSTDLCQTAWDI